MRPHRAPYDYATASRAFPGPAFLLGLAIEKRGNAWSTWLVDLDDEPTHPNPAPERRGA